MKQLKQIVLATGLFISVPVLMSATNNSAVSNDCGKYRISHVVFPQSGDPDQYARVISIITPSSEAAAAHAEHGDYVQLIDCPE